MGNAAANRHVNHKEMAVHVPVVSSSSFSMVIPWMGLPRKGYGPPGDISIRKGVEYR